jgi:multidrug efflux pump subunit AcrA (membrane-fusion protein)
MATLTQQLTTYAYLNRPSLAITVVDDSNGDVALLAQIDALLASAGAAFAARNYADALDGYFACQSLIYAHLDPQWRPELGWKLRTRLSRDASLFAPLLGATAQWLNVLTVPTPVSPVRPPTELSAQQMASVANLHGAGLGIVSANPTTSAEALADARLSTIYAAQGNTAASTVASARAKQLNGTIAGAFGSTTVTAVAQPAATQSLPTASSVSGAIESAGVARAPAVLANGHALGSLSPNLLETIARIPIPTVPSVPQTLLAQRQAGILEGNEQQFDVKTITWAANAAPDIATITSTLYTAHATAKVLPDVLMIGATLTERALILPHDYFYTIPLAIAQCYQALGDYTNAESYYLEAAGYVYINTAVEGPYIWLQLANLYRVWGDSLYRQDDAVNAAAVYGKVVTAGTTTAPGTALYTLAGLAAGATIAKNLLPQLATLVANGTAGVAADDVAIAAVLLQIYGRLEQISAGLDFWGMSAANVPIWTFAYLQQVATTFAQLAQQCEQSVISFWTQAQQATLTKTELTNQVAQANGQVAAAQQSVAAAQAQAGAYQAGLTVAQTRAADAATDASQYAATNSQVILIQATAQQVQGGDDGDWQGVSDMASSFLAGWTISGDSATVAAASNLAANRLSQAYQVGSMQRTATEMQQAATQAQAQLTAANAQVTAEQANLAVAQLTANGAAQTLAVFDADRFTPQVWTSMGNYLQTIYERYLDMALRAARLMQQAYNFENDATLAVIKTWYPGVVDGLLAADALLADVESFTDDLITTKRGKKQYVKQSISLASRYGYVFESQLRKTGTMTFETTLDDFDSAYPGTYQGRIQRVTVDVRGIVPPTGVSGTLANNGISLYRLPSDVATPAIPSKVRIQSAESLVISDYTSMTDGVIDSTSGGQSGIFEGAGIASSWTLNLPKAINDIDYGTLTDVVLTFLYEARFDAQLVAPVLAQLASRPGYYTREMTLPLAWTYPDLFYGFVSTGTLTLNLDASDFATNQTNPTIGAIGLLVSLKPGGPPANGITIGLSAPGKAAANGVTDATGSISSQSPGSPWATSVGGSALGAYTFTLNAAANPALAPGGTLDLSSLTNLVLVIDYAFAPRT